MRSIFILFASFFIINSSALAIEKQVENPSGDYVVILHGIARSSKHMKKLAKYLKKEGYDVINLDYPSTDYTLEDLTEMVHKDLSNKLSKDKPVHFIGYSMGGILVRTLLNKHKPKNLGRVVQLAPPNNGSEVADALKNNWLYKKIYGPAGQQLITNQDKIKSLLGEVNYELGIIAGNSSIDPISSFIIPGKDDGKVSIKSTKLKGMKDHIVVSSCHTFFPSNKTVHKQTKHFLEHGEFEEK